MARLAHETVEYFDEPVYRRPPPPPKRPAIDRRIADPREALMVEAGKRGYPLAGLSRMLRRHDGYLGRFVREGIPLCLTEREHRLLADAFDLDERGLGIRDLWAERRDA